MTNTATTPRRATTENRRPCKRQGRSARRIVIKVSDNDVEHCGLKIEALLEFLLCGLPPRQAAAVSARICNSFALIGAVPVLERCAMILAIDGSVNPAIAGRHINLLSKCQ